MNTHSSSLPFIAQNDDELPNVPENLTTEADPATQADAQDHTERQVNLHQATAALALAYHRIHQLRQFRRGLLDVPESSNSGESPNQTSRVVYPAFNSHTTAPEPNGVEESLIVPHGIEVNNEIPSLFPAQTLSNSTNTPPFDNFRTSDNSLNSPISYPRLPRSQLESRFLRHRETLTDDASTTLGRRVAAREAAGVSNSSSTSRYDGRSTQAMSALEQEFDNYVDNYLAVLRERRSAATSGSDTWAPPFFRRTDLRRQRSPRTREDGTSPSNSIAPRSDIRRRLAEGLLSTRSETTSSRSERLSLLSNFSSVQNLPTPIVDSSARPLLFEEPSSYLSSDFMNESRNDTTTRSLSQEPHRSYVVRRRFNADGEEHVHPINLDWLDEQYTPYSARQDTPDSLPVAQPRRRGWARLDPDGNEIPSEEEEALERARTEYRIRRQTQRGFPQTRDPGHHVLPAPTTSTSITPDDIDGGIPRVRLNNSGMQASAVKADMAAGHWPPVPVAPFRPNPLPMPIEDMIWTPPSRKPICPNRVSKNASFAGR